MAVRLFEAVWVNVVVDAADAAEVPERPLLVEARMLEDIWAFDNVLILGDGAEALERAVLVEAKMLEHIWIFSDVLEHEGTVNSKIDVVGGGA